MGVSQTDLVLRELANKLVNLNHPGEKVMVDGALLLVTCVGEDGDTWSTYFNTDRMSMPVKVGLTQWAAASTTLEAIQTSEDGDIQ